MVSTLQESACGRVGMGGGGQEVKTSDFGSYRCVLFCHLKVLPHWHSKFTMPRTQSSSVFPWFHWFRPSSNAPVSAAGPPALWLTSHQKHVISHSHHSASALSWQLANIASPTRPVSMTTVNNASIMTVFNTSVNLLQNQMNTNQCSSWQFSSSLLRSWLNSTVSLHDTWLARTISHLNSIHITIVACSLHLGPKRGCNWTIRFKKYK